MHLPNLFSDIALPVAEITRYLRAVFESDDLLQNLWVRGEISNLSRPGSGHVYFTLKDATAALRCVIWKSNAGRLRFDLQNGMEVEAHGSIGLYERDGSYQLYVDTLRSGGEGALYQQFLRLKARLEQEGIFDEERKRPLPVFPAVIGVVTSPTGAAFQDILNTLRQRFPLAEVVLAPAAVQGETAPAEIISALADLNNQAHPDVILLARGGGSLEDLMAFNDEGVVRAVAGSQAPVVTGVGHETDTTLVDYAADRRAPTPTGAAVMATPDIADLGVALDHANRRLAATLAARAGQEQRRLQEINAAVQRCNPRRRILNDRQRLDELETLGRRLVLHSLQLRRSGWVGMQNRVQSLNPLSVLQRGFAVVSLPDGSLVHGIGQVQKDARVQVRLADGDFNARVGDVNPLAKP